MKKILNYISVLFIVSLLTLSCTKDPEIKSTDASGRIVIFTAQTLAKIGVDANYPLDGDYVLTADIDLSGYENWTPITCFKGTFDGNNKVIYGLKIYDATSYENGLFTQLSGATIRNLKISEPFISGSSVGTIAGSAYSATIENCSVEGGSILGDSYAGGLIAESSGSNIINCYNTANISGSSNIGGVVGYAFDNTSFLGCHNAGTVSGGSTVGGIVGHLGTSNSNSTTIISCYNTGAVSGKSYIGGVIGSADDSFITTCYNTGAISGSSNFIGGVIGSDNSSAITACYSTGAVTGSSYVGGVIGSTYASSMTACYSTGAVLSNSNVGALVGYSSNYSSFTSCYFIYRADNTSLGIGNYTTSSYDYMLLSSVTQLNNVVSTMNSAAGGEYFTAGSPSDTNLPYLKGENLLYFGKSLITDDAGNILISSAEDLAMVSLLANSQLDGNYILTANINLSEYENWIPIGTSSNPFTGSFDGREYTITNLKINSTLSCIGLFGYASGAKISNITISEPDINGGTSCTAAICGFLYSGTIDNCAVEGGIVSGDCKVGGVVGMTSSSSVTSCYNTGAIECSSGGLNYVGGVVGYGITSTITSCNNSGVIESSNNNNNPNYVGGVVGLATSESTTTISSFYNSGIIKSNSTGSSLNTTSYVGGVAGSISSITLCYNTGSIENSNTTSSSSYSNSNSVGGVAGEVLSSATSCYNIGSINSCCGCRNYHLGGVFGYASAIIACYNTGSIKSIGTGSSSTASLYMTACSVGGVIGFISSSVISCYNTGVIESSSSNTYNYIGTIVGYASSSITSITSCYFIDYVEDDVTVGIGNTESGYAAATVASVSDLNGYVNTMNNSAEAIYFTAGLPSDTNLPHLMGENLEYVGD